MISEKKQESLKRLRTGVNSSILVPKTQRIKVLEPVSSPPFTRPCQTHIMFACPYHIRTTHSHNQISLTLSSFSPFCPHTRPCPFRSTVCSCPFFACLTSRDRDRSHNSLSAFIQHTREIRLCLLALFALSLPSFGHVLSVSCPVLFMCRHSSSDEQQGPDRLKSALLTYVSGSSRSQIALLRIETF